MTPRGMIEGNLGGSDKGLTNRLHSCLEVYLVGEVSCEIVVLPGEVLIIKLS